MGRKPTDKLDLLQGTLDMMVLRTLSAGPANGYEIAGPCREVFLESIADPPGFEGALVEIQFPVRRAA